MTTEVHHRHPVHGVGAMPPLSEQRESAPLLSYTKHMSMDDDHDNKVSLRDSLHLTFRLLSVFCGIVGVLTAVLLLFHKSSIKKWTPLMPIRHHRPTVIPIEAALEYWVWVDENHTMKVWYRTWGNRETGQPVLFVHGGPGNAIADYNNGNKKFFSDELFFVVEVDQRGTGNSQPSVRDNWRNMKYYMNISIDEIVADFEIVRTSLDIEQWMVWGGSFGSTLAINYATRYPERCLALILRGIYLDTVEEVEAVYSRSTYVKNPNRLAEFDEFFDYAQLHSDEPLNANNAQQILRAYERLIQSGDRYAIWHWHAFENNLMETEPDDLLDPEIIGNKVFPEAQSVAFFETRLWLHGSWESPSNLLSRIDQLNGFPIWICQGQYDEVCPPKYAQKFANALQKAGAEFTFRSIPSGHEQTDPVMEVCLQKSLREFIEDGQSLN